jgi:predicted RNase H-like nuclease
LSEVDRSTPIGTIGIDGCRGGWVWMGDLGEGFRAGLAPELEALVPILAGAQLTLIDMPIGLLDGGSLERRCDQEARALLGRPRASSVFRAPSRPALEAIEQGHAAACAINRQTTGVGLSLQTFNIMPKIRELDRLLQRHPCLRTRVRESHPELCLCGLNRGQPMRFGKRTAVGQRERRHVLRCWSSEVEAMIDAVAARYPRRALAVDDLVDAAVLAITARRIQQFGLGRELPSRPVIDGAGLPMSILISAD